MPIIPWTKKKEEVKPVSEEQSKPKTDVPVNDNQDEKKEEEDNREKSPPLAEGNPSKKDLTTLCEKAMELSKDAELEDQLIQSRIEPPPTMYKIYQADEGKDEKQDDAETVTQLFERLMTMISKNDLPTALDVIKKELTSLVDNPEKAEADVLRTVDRNSDVWKENVLKINETEKIMTAAGFVIVKEKDILEMKKEAFDEKKVHSIVQLCDKTISKCKAGGSDDGVSLKILKRLSEEYEGCEEMKSFSHGQSFVQNVVIPATEKDNCSYVEYLKKKGEARENVGRVNVYVCHSWLTPFKSVFAALEKYESLRNDKLDRRYYLDYLAVNQNLSAEQRKDAYPIGNLQNILEGVKEFVLVVNEWDFKSLPIPLRRKWCLYEIAIARSADVQFFVTMPKSQHGTFVKTVMCNNGLPAAAKVIFGVDIDQAMTSEPQDSKIIQELVTEKFGGSEDFNNYVSNYLLWWLQRVVVEIYSNWPPTEKISKLQLQFVEQITFFFFQWGNPEAAEYGKRSIKLSGELGMDTLQKLEILAKRCINMGKFSEVVAPLQELITAEKNNLPEIPTEADAKKMFKWVDLLVTALTRGKAENAVKLKRLLSREEERLGKPKNRHLKELVKLTEIATGDFFEDALKPMEDLLKRVLQTNQSTDPIALRLRFNLIHLYSAVGKHEGIAEKMEDEFIQDATKLFGVNSLHVLNVKVVHGKTLSTLGKQEDAKNIFEDVINLGAKIYGEKHVLVEKAKSELEKMEKDKEEQKEEQKIEEVQ